jgi:two-component system response regulator YesN
MGPLKVVLADDERWIRSLLRSIVRWDKLGARIVGEAEDGAAALALCRTKRPHLLISDIRMPGMDGLELIERVRQEMPELQCVIVSGYDEFELARRAVRLGVLDYLLKPLEARQVAAVLRRAGRRVGELQEQRREREALRTQIGKLQVLLDEDEGPQGARGGTPVKDLRIRRALAYMEENLGRCPTLQEVASVCFLSDSYFSEKFKQEVGVGFSRHLSQLRLRRAVKLIEGGELKCREIAEMLGFSSESYFSRVFRKACGCTPEEYRRKVLSQA